MRTPQQHAEGVRIFAAQGNGSRSIGAIAEGFGFLELGVGSEHGFENGGGEAKRFPGQAEDHCDRHDS